MQLASASPHEVTLIESTLDRVAVPRRGRGRPRKNPERLIYDKAADSDALRRRLERRGIDLICPHKRGRVYLLQDGRKLRRYCRRWKIERTIAWIGNFRRLVVRYEHKIKMFSGLRPCCLHAHYLETVMKPLLVNCYDVICRLNPKHVSPAQRQQNQYIIQRPHR